MSGLDEVLRQERMLVRIQAKMTSFVKMGFRERAKSEGPAAKRDGPWHQCTSLLLAKRWVIIVPSLVDDLTLLRRVPVNPSDSEVSPK